MNATDSATLARRLRDSAHRHNGVFCDSADKATWIEAADRIEALEGASDYAHAAHGPGRFPRICLICFANTADAMSDVSER